MNDAIVRNLCPDHRDKIKGLPCLKCVADRYLRFIDEAVDVLDPEMHQNDIRRIRDKAIQAKNAFETQKTEGFRIPVHGSYWEDFQKPVKYRMCLSDTDPTQLKIVLSYFQAVWPEADETSLKHYPNKGWTILGVDVLECNQLLISKIDFSWVLATIDDRDLPDGSYYLRQSRLNNEQPLTDNDQLIFGG